MADLQFVFGPRGAFYCKLGSEYITHALPKSIQNLLSGPLKAKQIYTLVLGESADTYLVAYRSHLDRDRCTFNSLPYKLEEWLLNGSDSVTRNLPTLRITLGPNDRFSAYEKGHLFSYEPNAKGVWEERRNDNFTEVIEHGSCGVDDSVVVRYKGDTACTHNVTDNYPMLKAILEPSSAAHLSEIVEVDDLPVMTGKPCFISLDPFGELEAFILVTTTNQVLFTVDPEDDAYESVEAGMEQVAKYYKAAQCEASKKKQDREAKAAAPRPSTVPAPVKSHDPSSGLADALKALTVESAPVPHKQTASAGASSSSRPQKRYGTAQASSSTSTRSLFSSERPRLSSSYSSPPSYPSYSHRSTSNPFSLSTTTAPSSRNNYSSYRSPYLPSTSSTYNNPYSSYSNPYSSYSSRYSPSSFTQAYQDLAAQRTQAYNSFYQQRLAAYTQQQNAFMSQMQTMYGPNGYATQMQRQQLKMMMDMYGPNGQFNQSLQQMYGSGGDPSQLLNNMSGQMGMDPTQMTNMFGGMNPFAYGMGGLMGGNGGDPTGGLASMGMGTGMMGGDPTGGMMGQMMMGQMMGGGMGGMATGCSVM